MNYTSFGEIMKKYILVFILSYVLTLIIKQLSGLDILIWRNGVIELIIDFLIWLFSFLFSYITINLCIKF